MTRTPLDYAARSQRVHADGFDPDTPIAGFYRMRLRTGAVYVGIRIWFGAPLDPVTFEPLDRSHRWCAAANGRPIDLERVWPRCARERVSAEEYAYLTSLQGWAEDNAPDTPFADPTRRVDPINSPILF